MARPERSLTPEAAALFEFLWGERQKAIGRLGPGFEQGAAAAAFPRDLIRSWAEGGAFAVNNVRKPKE